MPAPDSADQYGATNRVAFTRRLWLGVFLLNLFVVALASNYIYLSWRGDVERARTITQNLSLVLEREIAGAFDNADLGLKNLADIYADMSRLDLVHVDKWNAAVRRQRTHLPVLEGMRGTDANGIVVYGMEPDDPRGVSVADRPVFAMHRDNRNWGLLISEPALTRIKNRWSLVLSRRLEDGNGKFGGIIVATIPLDYFARLFSSIKIGERGSIAMRDAGLRLIVRHPALGEGGQIGSARVSDDFLAALQLDRSAGTYHAGLSTIDGVQRTHSYRLNPAYSFYVNVGVSDDEYLSAWRGDLVQIGMIVCLFLLVSMFFARRWQRAWILQQASSAQLARSEADYRALADDAPYGVALLGNDGAVAYLNPAFTRMLGYGAGDLPDISAWWNKAYPNPKYRQSVMDAWQRSVIEPAFPGTVESEVTVCRSDGAPCDVRSLIVKMGDGRITVTFEDITARKRAEAALQKSEDQFRMVVEQSPLAMALVCMDGTIEYINRRAIDTFGYSPEDIPNMDRWWAQAYPDAAYRAEVVAMWTGLAQQALADNREIEKHEYRVTCKDGGVKVAAIFGVWIRGRVIVIFEDVSERKKIEERMHLARQIFDTASEPIFVCDVRGQILEVNAEACRLAKYTREQLLRMRSVDIVAPEEIPRVARELAVYDAGAVVKGRWLLLCSDGSTVPLEVVVQRLPGDRYLGIGRDLTEREKVLGQLAEALDKEQAANMAKSRFLAAASHDLRQPIQAINLFCIALAGTPLSGMQKQISEYLALSAKGLGDILSTLLDISKLDAGHVTPEPERIRISTMFRNIDAEFSPLASEKQLRFRLHFPAEEMAVLTDPRLLQSLLGNLIGNAVKYTQRGGILVAVRRRGRHALIQVWDTGVGISQEHIKSIFDEYFQIGNVERDKSKGLGLGLAIARRVAQLLGTDVVCRSRPGRGSVFEVRMPLAEGMPLTAAKGIGLSGPLHAAVRRVVVVEDDRAVANSIKFSLESRGMAVTIYGSAEEVLANAELPAADFYISDLRLPGLNGLELLGELQRRSGKPIHAVILTGDTSPERVELARSSRWPLLFKPVDLSDLLSAIESQVSAG